MRSTFSTTAIALFAVPLCAMLMCRQAESQDRLVESGLAMPDLAMPDSGTLQRKGGVTRLPSTEAPPAWLTQSQTPAPLSFPSEPVSSEPASSEPLQIEPLQIGAMDEYVSPPARQPSEPFPSSAVQNAFAALDAEEIGAVQPIPAFTTHSQSNRIVRYEVPLDDVATNQAFLKRGIEGQLVEVPDPNAADDSITQRLKTFWSPIKSRQEAKKIRVVRYEVPADDIIFHSQLSSLDGELIEPGMLRLPEVRFFQPKARVFMDLKRSNDGEFDLFNDGAILASLDVIELYFPMPLISERFADVFGKRGTLASLGWRVGGTVGLGITTALNNGGTENGSAPVSTLSAGIRYEFPLGRPSRELIETRDIRLDHRTRVGMEFGVQGGISTRESLDERTDVGLYFGILVNTPWGG